jgi:hypothetical protein
MTIPFGRRRLIFTFALVASPPANLAETLPLDASDAELATLSRHGAIDIDRARWEGLTLIYGGARRP